MNGANQNTALGECALAAQTNASGNTAIGFQTGIATTEGGCNTYIGACAGKNSICYSNTYVGFCSGVGTTNANCGFENVAIGDLTLKNVTTGNNNVLLGYNAQAGSNSARGQVVIGPSAVGVDGDNVVTIGNANVSKVYMAQDQGATVYLKGIAFADGTSMTTAASGSGSSGSSTLLGLDDVLSETNSLYVGNDPSSTTNAANFNLSVGVTSLDAITTGDNNTAVGYNSLGAAKIGSSNTGIGKDALKLVTNGSFNTAVGNTAGDELIGGTSNTLIGHNASTNLAGSINRTAIGAGAQATKNKTVVLGNSSVEEVWMAGDKAAVVYAAKYYLTDGTEIGQKGDTGATGAQGPKGDTGAAGADGADGQDGADGASGVAGAVNDLTDGYKDTNNFILGETTSNLSLGSAAIKNTIIGANDWTGAKLGAGFNNTTVGFNAGKKITSGKYNTLVGTSAGQFIVGGSSNVFIGNNSGVQAANAGAQNRIALGSGITHQLGNNIAVIGNASVTSVYMAYDGEAVIYLSLIHI